MILSFAKVLKSHNLNYQTSLLVQATDISDTCAYMTYIQLSLYKIPAIVSCGDALSNEKTFTMVTPSYFSQLSKFNPQNNNSRLEQSDKKQINIDKPIEKQILLKETTVKGNCQISLW